ncbi:MAG: S41 family peptidase [Oscillospiraceae bacterium]|nr:S41 family peptidase [Oscillospiraceae bacterium]
MKLTKKKEIISICALLLVAGIVFVALGGMLHIYSFLFDPHRGTVSDPEPTLELSHLLTREEAIADIDYILRYLKSRHPAALRGIPEAVLEQSRTEKENFSEQVTVLQLWQAAARILAVFGDSHTNVGVYIDPQDYYLQSSYYRFTDGVLYFARGEFEGSAVISIAGIPVEDLERTFKEQFPVELEAYADYLFSHAVRWRHFLMFLNAEVSEQIIVVFETPGGEIISKEYSFSEWEVPKDDDEDDSFVFYEIDKENSVGIFTLTNCKYNDIFCETLEEFFTEVKENELQTVVVDLRKNGGGFKCVITEFMRYLDIEHYADSSFKARYGPVFWHLNESRIKNDKFDDLTFSGDIYVLTSTRTYSAATILAAVISDNGLGKIVGEASGQPIPFYAGMLYFETPNAKLHFGISGSYISRPDESKTDSTLTPDYPSAADEALETVYKLLQQQGE